MVKFFPSLQPTLKCSAALIGTVSFTRVDPDQMLRSVVSDKGLQVGLGLSV